MEIVILPDNEAIGSLGADAIGNLLQRKPDAVLGLATGSSPLAIYDELAARCARRHACRSPRPAVSPSTSTWGCPPTTRSPTGTSSTRTSCPGSTSRQAPSRARTGWPRTSPPLCAAYEAAMARGRRGRPADPGHRHRRAHRLQRAGLLAGLAHPDQDADPADPDRQRPILRRRPGRGAHALPDPGPGHHHVRPARRAGRDRHAARPRRCTTWSRARSARCGRATILQHHPHVTVLLDERGREPAAAGRLLPRDLPGQAGLAGHLSPSSDHPTRPPTARGSRHVDHRRYRRHRSRSCCGRAGSTSTEAGCARSGAGAPAAARPTSSWARSRWCPGSWTCTCTAAAAGRSRRRTVERASHGDGGRPAPPARHHHDDRLAGHRPSRRAAARRCG